MSERKIIQTWYRSVRDGKTWCESSSAQEVIERSRPTDTYSKFDVVMVYEDWVPWTP